MSLHIRPNSVKKDTTNIFINVKGVKKEVVSAWVRRDGKPAQVFGKGAKAIYLFIGNTEYQTNMSDKYIPIYYSYDLVNYKSAVLGEGSAVWSTSNIDNISGYEITYVESLGKFFAYIYANYYNSSYISRCWSQITILESIDGKVWKVSNQQRITNSSTYSRIGTIDAVFGEPNIGYLKERNLLFYFITITAQSDGVTDRYIVYSRDGGVNWTRDRLAAVTGNFLYSGRNWSLPGDGYLYMLREVTLSSSVAYLISRTTDGSSWSSVKSYSYTDFGETSSVSNFAPYEMLYFNGVYILWRTTFSSTLNGALYYSIDNMSTWVKSLDVPFIYSESDMHKLIKINNKIYFFMYVSTTQWDVYVSNDGKSFTKDTGYSLYDVSGGLVYNYQNGRIIKANDIKDTKNNYIVSTALYNRLSPAEILFTKDFKRFDRTNIQNSIVAYSRSLGYPYFRYTYDFYYKPEEK